MRFFFDERNDKKELVVWPLLLGIQAGVRNTPKDFYSPTRRHVDFLPRSHEAQEKGRNEDFAGFYYKFNLH